MTGSVPGGAPGYAPSGTLSFAVEFARQWRRRRTRAVLGFMLVLPAIILFAFEVGGDGEGGGGDRTATFASVVDVAQAGGLNFALFTLFVSSGFLLVVVAALFHGDTVASEASWGTLRYLLAIPVPRGRLLAVKLSVAYAYTLLSIGVLVGAALAMGTLRYGWEPLVALAADIPPGAGLVRVAGIAGYIALALLFVGGLAFLFSVLTNAPLGAVGGAVLIYILSSILDQIDALGIWRNLLPTHFYQAFLGMLATPIQAEAMVKGAVSAVAYGSIMAGIAFRAFVRRDITS